MENDEQHRLILLQRMRIQHRNSGQQSKKDQPPSEKKEVTTKEVKQPPAKKVLEPPSEELLKKHRDLVAVGEECLEEAELLTLMQSKPTTFRLYDGFEPSGRMHIAQGVFKSINVNTCTKAGGEFVFWVADFFALMNDKMGGDLKKIFVVGEYLVEVWKAAGMNMDKVRFIWASEAIIERADIYSRVVADIARRFTVARLVKCCQIMGRKEGNLSAAQVLYPLMQCADVFFLEADVCQLGIDQRKVNMLARDYAQVAGKRFKPIILSHHMLFGLKKGQEKMSKSDPDSAIFMEDSLEDIERKIKQAYCPNTVPEGEKDNDESLLLNPCLDYIKHICMRGENVEFAGFKTFKEVRASFIAGELKEEDLKRVLIEKINEKILPVREHFSTGKPLELLNSIKQFKEEAKLQEIAKEEARVRASLEVPDDAEVSARRKPAGEGLPLLRRCNPKALNGTAASSVVFLPPPKVFRGIMLADVISVVVRLSRALLSQTEEEKQAGEKVVLFVNDLGFICQNALSDFDTEAAAKRKVDDKGPFATVGKKSSPTLEIEAYISTFLACVQSLMKDFSSILVIKETDLMSEDPLNYLLSIINVGRAFKLEEALAAVGIKDIEGGRVGHVISALFQVADVLALGPAKRILYETSTEEALVNFALSFFYTNFAKDYECGQVSIRIKVEIPSLHLLKNPEDSDIESVLYVSDEDKDVANKIKRTFCEIGNVALNPTLNGLCALFEIVELKHLFPQESDCILKVKRTEENGGDMKFKSVSEIFDSFALGTIEGEFPKNALHPGDLKTAVTPIIKQLVEKTRKAIPPAASKVLEAAKKRNPERLIVF